MNDRPVILAIETSQRSGSVASSLPGGDVDDEPLRTTARHEDDLMPAIDRLCQRHAVAPGQITAVGVSIGPGGFTGLRIAVSTAKMLAESLGAALVGVPSALVATEHIDARGPIMVCLASKREATWVTRLERTSDDRGTPAPALPRALRFRGRESEQHAGAAAWHIVGQAGLATADTIDLTGIELVLADEHLPDALCSRIAEAHCTIIEPKFDARACLAVAKRMIGANETTDSLSLTPIYARPPEAVRLWERGSDTNAPQ